MAEALYTSTSMTFDLTPELEARLRSARDLAARVIAHEAEAVDTAGAFPDAVVEAIDRLGLWASGPLDAVIALEELGAVSGSAAARAAIGPSPDANGWPLAGLRGVATVAAPTDRQRLGMAAVAVGLGRAAVAEAIAAMKAHGDRPSGDPADPPHWMLADAATEIDAARLVVQAAAVDDLSGAAAAVVFAGSAAVRAVDAATRVVGAGAFRPGSALERMGRDARAVLLIVGTEDAARVVAADRLLGRAQF
jgi:alkylation response protein AidB-like acyl-CoA dehydrogenase